MLSIFIINSRNQFLTITVLASDGPEPEENFTIALTAATKGVAIDEEGQYALLTVSAVPYLHTSCNELILNVFC